MPGRGAKAAGLRRAISYFEQLLSDRTLRAALTKPPAVEAVTKSPELVAHGRSRWTCDDDMYLSADYMKLW